MQNVTGVKVIFGFILLLLVFGCGALRYFSFPQPYPILGNPSSLYPQDQEFVQALYEQINHFATKYPYDIIVNGKPSQKVVALTFDDGPDGIITPAVLDILKEHGVHATFFFLGKNIARYKDVVRRAHREGHAIFNHTWNHKHLTRITEPEIEEEIESTHKALTDAIGPIERYIRLPFGEIDDKVFKVIKRLRYKSIMWSLDTYDWSPTRKATDISATIPSVLRPGEIVLMHTMSYCKATADALKDMIRRIKSQGFEFARIDDAGFLGR